MFNLQHKRDHHFPEIARKLGFKLNNNLGEDYKIDWRYVGCLDMNEILQENDFERIEHGLAHISDASLGTILKNSILDPAVSKYFILAQFSIQYLQFCRTFLEETIYGINKQLSDNEKEICKLHKSNRKKDSEILGLHKKLESCIVANNNREMVFPCTKCTKNFISTEMLAAHMNRKHSSMLEASSSVENTNQDARMINMIKLELEVKQLKEKLITKDKQPTINLQDVGVQVDEIHKKFVSIGIQTNFEEPKDKNDFEENVKTIVQNQQNYLENMHKNEIQRYENEMSDMRRQLTETFNELKKLHSTNNGTSDQTTRVKELLESKLVELKSLYFQNQNQIAESLSTLDEKYSRNFKNLEQIIESKNILPPVQVIEMPPKTLRDQAVLTETMSYSSKIFKNSIERSEPSDETSPQIMSPISESSESEAEVQVVTKAQINIPPSIANRDTVIKTILAQQISKPDSKPISTVESILNSKLIEFGINPDLKRLTSVKFSESMARLAEQREYNKRRFSKFFITRANIIRGLDRKVNEKFKFIQAPSVPISVKPVPQPRRLLSERTSTIESSTPVLEVQDESIRMYQEVDEENSTSDASDLENIPKSGKVDDILTLVSDPAKPIPKKRVLFDLHRKNNDELMIEENVSDWEISSFSSNNK